MQAQKPQDLDCVSEACNRLPDSETPAREVTPAVHSPTPLPQTPTPADLGGPEPRVFEFDVPPDAWEPVVDGSQPTRDSGRGTRPSVSLRRCSETALGILSCL